MAELTKAIRFLIYSKIFVYWKELKVVMLSRCMTWSWTWPFKYIKRTLRSWSKQEHNWKNCQMQKSGQRILRVSLIYNQIQEIPSSHSPRCLSLSTLLLGNNTYLQFIAGSLFEQLHGLNVLDLSHTIIEKLPASVSDLVCLTALLLEGCKRLSHVPSLKNSGHWKG